MGKELDRFEIEPLPFDMWQSHSNILLFFLLIGHLFVPFVYFRCDSELLQSVEVLPKLVIEITGAFIESAV